MVLLCSLKCIYIVYNKIEVLKSSSENALWFVLNNVLFEPVLFGIWYVPSERSDYSSIDIFDVIEAKLLKYAVEKNSRVCLIGDFNAHTGKKEDFIDINQYVCDFIHLDNETKKDFDFVNLETLGICTERHYNSW